MGLYDMVMVKDNHLLAEIRRPRAASRHHPRPRRPARTCASNWKPTPSRRCKPSSTLEGVDVILLDNMSLDDLRAAVALGPGSSRAVRGQRRRESWTPCAPSPKPACSGSASARSRTRRAPSTFARIPPRQAPHDARRRAASRSRRPAHRRARIGSRVLVFEETDSTNDLAARAGDDGLPEGLVIFAESQRAGRGTLGPSSGPRRRVGALLFSILLRPPAAVPVERWAELTFCAALAVAETAEEFTGQPARIKWPNDVLVAGRKIAGILLEAHHRQTPGFVVVGIGVNVPESGRFRAGTARTRRFAGMMASGGGGCLWTGIKSPTSLLMRLSEHYYPLAGRICVDHASLPRARLLRIVGRPSRLPTQHGSWIASRI